jgi:hypothetical protein
MRQVAFADMEMICCTKSRELFLDCLGAHSALLNPDSGKKLKIPFGEILLAPDTLHQFNSFQLSVGEEPSLPTHCSAQPDSSKLWSNRVLLLQWDKGEK